MAVQAALPLMDGALIEGPVFFDMTVDGAPGFKGRHRDRIVFPKDPKKRPFVHRYPDPDTEAYEKMIAQYARLRMGRRLPTRKPVSVVIWAFRAVPKSWSIRDREAALSGRILPTPKPDADNHSKVKDALKGIVWIDDAQVVDDHCYKRYSERPRWQIEVREYIPP